MAVSGQIRCPRLSGGLSDQCVFSFFFRKSWLAGEGDHLLRKKKLKMRFAAVMIPDVCFPVPASQNVRTISRRYRDGWALRCRCAHVVPPRGAALAAVGRRGTGGTGRALLRRVSGPRAESPKAGKKKGISSQSTKCRSPFACPQQHQCEHCAGAPAATGTATKPTNSAESVKTST